MRVLIFDSNLCNGTRVCEVTCSQTWFKEANPAKSALRICEGEEQTGRYVANVCNQCGECIDVCPTMALKRDFGKHSRSS